MEDGAKGEDEVLKLISKLMSLMPSGVDLEIGRMGDRATWRMTGGTPEQRASAQAILDAFDPAQAQAEVEAEETAEKTQAEKLRALAEWLRTQSKDVREKFADIQSAMESGRSEIAKNRQHIKYIEQFISAKYPAAFKPQQWSQTGAAGETGDGQRNG